MSFSYVDLTTYIKFHRTLETIDNSLEYPGDVGEYPGDYPGESSYSNNIFIESHLIAATGQANSYLGVRYKIPILNPSDYLKKVVCSIAKYEMEILGDIRAATEKHYEKAIDWLEDIRDGKMALLDALNAVVPEKLDVLDPETEERMHGKMYSSDRSTASNLQIPQFGRGIRGAS